MQQTVYKLDRCLLRWPLVEDYLGEQSNSSLSVNTLCNWSVLQPSSSKLSDFVTRYFAFLDLFQVSILWVAVKMENLLPRP